MSLILFYKNLLTTNWLWIKKILIWILIWFIIGGLTPLFLPGVAHFFIESIITFFKKILGDGGSALDLSTVWIIFSQNARAMLIMLFLGIVVGIVPRLSTAFNFFIIGIVFVLTLERNLLGGLLFILLLMPHGIFEISALVISAAFGLRLGLFWKINKPELKNKQKFVLALKQNVQLVPLIILLLVCAAFMEVFVSGHLSQMLSAHIKISSLS